MALLSCVIYYSQRYTPNYIFTHKQQQQQQQNVCVYICFVNEVSEDDSEKKDVCVVCVFVLRILLFVGVGFGEAHAESNLLDETI